jgi:hypothetical protein
LQTQSQQRVIANAAGHHYLTKHLESLTLVPQTNTPADNAAHAIPAERCGPLKKEMQNKKLIITTGITIFIGLAIWGQISSKKKGLKDFKTFNESKIEGVIDSKVTASVGGVRIQVNGKKFNFHPVDADKNKKRIFQYVADINDSIIKPKHSDTLILINKDGKIKFTFSKWKY